MTNRYEKEVDWTEELIERLKKLWEAGWSMKEIAAELGNMTRCAVAGKVKRLGLAKRRSRPGEATRIPYKTVRVRVMPDKPRISSPSLVPKLPKEPVVELVIPEPRRLSLLELDESTCHWPVDSLSEKEFSFCGNKSLAGHPYCAEHDRAGHRHVARRVRAA